MDILIVNQSVIEHVENLNNIRMLCNC